MIEEQLRDAFARHEMEAPGVDTLRRGIDRLATRRRRRRVALRSGGVAAIVAIVLLAAPLIMRTASTGHLPGVAPASSASLPDRALNILVLGLDPVLAADGQKPGADSITVVHVSADRQRVYLVDIERDVLVDLPGHGRGKIGTAYAIGGAPLTVQVVQALTGVTVDGAVVLTIDALREMTDAVGGFDMCLPLSVKSIHTGRTFPPGCYHFDGTAVADLVRQREDLPAGAYTRDANVQRVLKSLATRVHSLNLLTDATRLASLLSVGGLQIDLGGNNAIALAAQLKNVDGTHVVGIVSPHYQSLPPDNGVAYEQLDPVVAPEMFAALRNDILDQFATAHHDWVVDPPPATATS